MDKPPLRESYNMEVRLKHPYAPQRPQQAALEGEEERLPANPIAVPQGWCGTVLSGLPRISGFESPGVASSTLLPALWFASQEPYSGLTPQGPQGYLWSSTTGNLTVTELERGLPKPALGSCPRMRPLLICRTKLVAVLPGNSVGCRSI